MTPIKLKVNAQNIIDALLIDSKVFVSVTLGMNDEQIAILNQRIASLPKPEDHASNAAASMNLTKKQNEINILLSELSNENVSISQQLDALKSVLSNEPVSFLKQASANQQSNELQTEKLNNSKQIELLKKEITAIDIQLSSDTADKDTLTKSKDDLSSQIEMLSNKNADIDKAVDQLSPIVKQSANRFDEYSKAMGENARLSTKLSANNSLIEQLNIDLKNITSQVDNTNGELLIDVSDI